MDDQRSICKSHTHTRAHTYRKIQSPQPLVSALRRVLRHVACDIVFAERPRDYDYDDGATKRSRVRACVRVRACAQVCGKLLRRLARPDDPLDDARTHANPMATEGRELRAVNTNPKLPIIIHVKWASLAFRRPRQRSEDGGYLNSAPAVASPSILFI